MDATQEALDTIRQEEIQQYYEEKELRELETAE